MKFDRNIAKSSNFLFNFSSTFAIPKYFDSREQWPHCLSIRRISDQSSCAAGAISDRICIASQGRLQVSISALDLLSCCKDCGRGCAGGFPIRAWMHWVYHGVVTGGDFNEKFGCQPYPFPPCAHQKDHTNQLPRCSKMLYATPQCMQKCNNNYYSKGYIQDKYYGNDFNNVRAIQEEIMRNGPVEAVFNAFSDFEAYHSGIYRHVFGNYLGGHAVKIIGWGEENSVPYWLAANSWNSDWGENGYFRILRGVNECGIETEIIAGLSKF
ncbi:unnamed protein product [Dracunculus medinensis]|uniref:Pept_C1 domain-containing protein n=1 Tax=Dracunculus medinensis TaxID=318479 RepID=A0A0N4UIM7_DRAME|nr:unnamed protein product [Dracunculus medinensis]